jgi:hypothetical protein
LTDAPSSPADERARAVLDRLGTQYAIAYASLEVLEVMEERGKEAQEPAPYRRGGLHDTDYFAWFVERALYSDVVLMTAKLLEARARRNMSLPQYLRFCEQNYPHLSFDPRRLSASDIRRQRVALEAASPQRDRLLKTRNEWLAHFAARLFDQPQEALRHALIPTSELRPLLRLAEDVIVSHKHARHVHLIPHLYRVREDVEVLDDLLQRVAMAERRWALDEASPEVILQDLFRPDLFRPDEDS